MGEIAIKPSHKGLFHRDLGKSPGEKISSADIQKSEHSKDPAERKRAVFAANARKWAKNRDRGTAKKLYGKKD